MDIDFDAISGSKGRVYRAMWDNDKFKSLFSDKIEKTISKGRESNDSYRFKVSGNKADTLIGVFGLANAQTFKEKFGQVRDGDGGEANRIERLISSALFALLFFYDVTRDNPLKLALDDKEVTFIDSIFEYKNVVIAGHKPSNVDVVLIGKDKSGKDVVLFLESKFAEYCYAANRKSCEVSNKYRDNNSKQSYSKPFYQGGVMPGTDLQIESKDKGHFVLKPSEAAYTDGIKQMVSHYVGIRNMLDGKSADKRYPRVLQIIGNGADVFLGEIVFDSRIGDMPLSWVKTSSNKTALASYEELYGKLSKVMNGIISSNCPYNFKALNTLLRYSSLTAADCTYRIDSKVKDFYYGS